MDPFVTGGLLQLGGGVLGGLSGAGRYNQALRGYKQADRRLGGMVGQTPYNPYQVAALQRRSIAGDTKRLGERLDNMYGMDIGSGAGGLWGSMLGQQQATLGRGIRDANSQRFNRDFDINALRYRGAMNRLGAVS